MLSEYRTCFHLAVVWTSCEGKIKLFSLVSDGFCRLLHSLPSFCIKTFFGVANCLNGIFLKWAGNYCFTDKQSRKWLSQIVAKHKGGILKCECYTVIYSILFSCFYTKDHIWNIFRISL